MPREGGEGRAARREKRPSDPLFEVVPSKEQNLVIQEAAYSLVDFSDGEEEHLARARESREVISRNGVGKGLAERKRDNGSTFRRDARMKEGRREGKKNVPFRARFEDARVET